jgi:hypothetical protein
MLSISSSCVLSPDVASPAPAASPAMCAFEVSANSAHSIESADTIQDGGSCNPAGVHHRTPRRNAHFKLFSPEARSSPASFQGVGGRISAEASMRDHASPQSHLSLENVDGRPSVGVDGHMISDGSIAVHWDGSRGRRGLERQP